MAFKTITVLNAYSNTVDINSQPDAGPQLSANSLPVVIATDQSNVAVTVQNTPTVLQGAGSSGNPWYFIPMGPNGNRSTVSNGGLNVNIRGTANVLLQNTTFSLANSTVVLQSTANVAINSNVNVTIAKVGPVSWNGGAVDLRGYGTVTIDCVVAPVSGVIVNRSPDGNTYFGISTSINNIQGISTANTINAVGSYSFFGGAFFNLSGTSNGTFFISYSN